MRNVLSALFGVYVLLCLWKTIFSFIFPFSDGQLNAVVGNNMSLSCNSISENVWWTKDGKNVTSADSRYVGLGHTHYMHKSKTIKLRKL